MESMNDRGASACAGADSYRDLPHAATISPISKLAYYNLVSGLNDSGNSGNTARGLGQSTPMYA